MDGRSVDWVAIAAWVLILLLIAVFWPGVVLAALAVLR